MMQKTGTKVAFLALDTYSRMGGMQRFNQRVISALADMACEADFARPQVRIMRDVESDLPKDVAADIIGFGPRRLDFIRSALSVARASDILLLGQVNLLPVGWMARRINPRLKIALFVHGIEVWNDPVYRKGRFYEPFLLSAVDRVASVSRYTADIMSREFRVSPQKFTIFPNAVDGPIVAPAEAGGDPVLLCVTRMAPHDHGKNVDKVLRAFAPLSQNLPNARLEIVGDGVLRPELEALAQTLGITSRVTFHGRVSDEELDACYRRARAFVLPSSKEGFGIVYLEAWKYGLPVICSSQGASSEVVTHGSDGFVVDPQDVDALEKAMHTLLSDTEASTAMGQRGVEKLRSGYLNAHFKANLKAILEELA
jgi:phosphatidyl-myo-inositol dimannoside synthase